MRAHGRRSHVRKQNARECARRETDLRRNGLKLERKRIVPALVGRQKVSVVTSLLTIGHGRIDRSPRHEKERIGLRRVNLVDLVNELLLEIRFGGGNRLLKGAFRLLLLIGRDILIVKERILPKGLRQRQTAFHFAPIVRALRRNCGLTDVDSPSPAALMRSDAGKLLRRANSALSAMTRWLIAIAT